MVLPKNAVQFSIFKYAFSLVTSLTLFYCGALRDNLDLEKVAKLLLVINA